ncbi:MAG: putative dehydrogenase [Kiritimatiellia bacterium]|jgi:predicted dehydrogenase
MAIGVGLIGCGGRLRAVVERLLKATDGVSVVAVHDPNEASVDAARAAFNPDATVHATDTALCEDAAVDWVMIGSWNCFHADQVIAAFAAGKHVFCEKPLALTMDDCLRMREAWQASGRQFSIGFTLRYSPHYVRVHELIQSGAIGNIISMEFNETLDFNHGGYIHADWRRKTEWAGSHLLEKCCHDIDLVNWMVGSTVVRAASFGGCDFFVPENAHHVDRLGKDEDQRDAFQVWSQRMQPPPPGNVIDPFGADKDIVDNQVAILQFANKVRVTFHTNCVSAIPERRMYICGDKGTIRADVMTGSIELKRLGFDTVIENCSTEASGGHGGGDDILAKSLSESMLEGVDPRTSLDDGLRAALTVFGIDEAMNTGRVVDLTPLWSRAGIAVA